MTLPKSKAELVASGTYRPSRHADRVDDQFPQDAPTVPADLSEDEAALFDKIVSTFPEGVLSPTDSLVLTMAVRWYCAWRKLDTILADDPTNYKTATLAAMASKQALSAFAKLGLNPIDRRKLSTPPPKEDEDDPFTLWLKAKNEADAEWKAGRIHE